jgi:hypothetical protein
MGKAQIPSNSVTGQFFTHGHEGQSEAGPANGATQAQRTSRHAVTSVPKCLTIRQFTCGLYRGAPQCVGLYNAELPNLQTLMNLKLEGNGRGLNGGIRTELLWKI